jgi:hypothetical protein
MVTALACRVGGTAIARLGRERALEILELAATAAEMA